MGRRGNAGIGWNLTHKGPNHPHMLPLPEGCDVDPWLY